MRYFVIACLSISLLNCHSKDVLPNATTTVLNSASQDNWTTERLNSDYNIQFPVGYEGNGAVGFEGLTFNKYRKDGKVKLGYSFCGSTFCLEYGQPLSSQFPATVTFNNVVLNKIVTLKRNGQNQGVFYHAEQDKTFGLLYLLSNGQLRESLNVQYDYSLQAEVLGVIQTIQPK